MKSVFATSVAGALLTTMLILVSATATRVVNSSNNGSISSNASFTAADDPGQSFYTIAKYNKYDPAKHDWKLTNNFACKKYEAPDWGSTYGWVAYCLPKNAVIGADICGQCVRIQKINMDYITARVVDQCSNEHGTGLVLDYDTVFSQIEKTEAGRASVEYHFVSCYQ
ncbi:PR4B [Linum grandiflorum]